MSKQPTRKGILIDAKNNSIESVSLGDHKTISKAGGYDYFDVVRFNKKDDVFVDDEGAINGTDFGFELLEGISRQPYMGNGVIMGRGINGESIDAFTSLEDVAKSIRCFTLTPNGKAVWFAKHPTIKTK